MAEEKTISREKDLRPIIIFFLTFIGLGILLILFYTPSLSGAAICLLWMLACIVAGAVIGFLFGIPKILQGNSNNTVAQNEENKDYRIQVNTNLTEISDWLTKIIVGLGLVNLTKLPPYIRSVAMVMADGLNAKDHASALSFSYGLISCYFMLGFLFGYLFTRLVLSKAFISADQEAFQQLKNKQNSTEIQLAALDSKQGIITQALYSKTADQGQAQGGDQKPSDMGDKLSRLAVMADDYLNIHVADWGERTRLKDEAADNMVQYAFNQNISKKAIFDLQNSSPNEGLVLTIAALINLNPESGDLDMLLQSGSNLKRLHVRYRVLLAIVSLYKKGYIKGSDKIKAIALVNAYRENADPHLITQINSTLSYINS